MKYRKKPVEIEARRVPDLYEEGDTRSIVDYVHECVDLATWCGGVSHMMDLPEGVPQYGIYIPTLEGTMCASPGDWIIKGVQGEFYPVKGTVFTGTYESVEANDEAHDGVPAEADPR